MFRVRIFEMSVTGPGSMPSGIDAILGPKTTVEGPFLIVFGVEGCALTWVGSQAMGVLKLVGFVGLAPTKNHPAGWREVATGSCFCPS